MISPDDIGKRYYNFDTLFGLSEACLYAQLVEFFEKNLKIDFKNLQQYAFEFHYLKFSVTLPALIIGHSLMMSVKLHTNRTWMALSKIRS